MINTPPIATTMVTLPTAGRVSSIGFRRPPLATTTGYVCVKASSRCSSWRTLTKSAGCEIHPVSDIDPLAKADESQNGSESMEKEMYEHFLTHEKLYQSVYEYAHLWERSKPMDKIYHHYKKAVYKSGHPNKRSIVISNSAVAYALVSVLQKYPYKFPMHHKAIRAPFDYYRFGLDYFRPLIDFKNSYVGNISIFQEIEEKIQKGENVVLMSNHPREVDLVFIALLLESTHPYICENMTYLMESGVLSNNHFYKIFNMGRTFIDRQVLEELTFSEPIDYDAPFEDTAHSTLREYHRSGSRLLWYSPVTVKGGVKWLFRALIDSGVPFHVYPLALLSIDHPIRVEQLLSFQGVGLSVGRRMVDCYFHRDYSRSHQAEMICHFINQQDIVLKSAIIEKHGLAASNDVVSLSQQFIS